MSNKERLKLRLDNEFDLYKEKWLAMSPEQLIEHCDQLEAVTRMYKTLLDSATDEDVEYLLRFRHPLEVVSDAWLSRNGMDEFDFSDEIGSMLWSLRDREGAEQDYELADEDPPTPQKTPSTQKINVTLKLTLTSEDIDDIMVTALEGGITYWCYRAMVLGEYLGSYASDQISRHGTLRLFIMPECLDDGEPESYDLTLDKFIQGVMKYVAEINPGIVENGRLDVCNIDAPAADTIIQYAIFDEVVYG